MQLGGVCKGLDNRVSTRINRGNHMEIERMLEVPGAEPAANSFLAPFPRASVQRWKRYSRETRQIIGTGITMAVKEEPMCLMAI